MKLRRDQTHFPLEADTFRNQFCIKTFSEKSSNKAVLDLLSEILPSHLKCRQHCASNETSFYIGFHGDKTNLFVSEFGW